MYQLVYNSIATTEIGVIDMEIDKEIERERGRDM